MTGAIELQPDDGPRSSLGIGPGSDDAMGPRQEFARRFTEGIRKLAGNTLGDRRKKTIGLVARMSEATDFTRVGTTSYSPPSLCARVVRSYWRSFAAEIHRVDTAREEDA
ncbi:hypothetical protein B296_00032622 [Ensete ventricosum]|uniref:Uncharacterized protein n=1 Tax=Ensete ventricosum TaxID=4639 RepID=A0A426X833_ENSVE|nr:hypothetical protein B296_00032622 [Ensete ventricosum]